MTIELMVGFDLLVLTTGQFRAVFSANSVVFCEQR